VVAGYIYLANGEIYSRGVGPAYPNIHPTPYLYTGEHHDPETGLIYLRARYYSPVMGRFVGVDPHPGSMSRPITLNDYAYANGDSVNGVDPSGEIGLLDAVGGLDISAALNVAAGNAARHVVQSKIKGPKISYYLGVRTLKQTIKEGVPHTLVYVEVIGTNSGNRYDVSVSDSGRKDFERRLKQSLNPATTGPGQLIEKPASRQAVIAEGNRLGKKQVSTTILQYQLWRQLAFDSHRVFDYCLIGTNCISWSAEAITIAKAVSKLKGLYP
jgi:RHS repeat-associated protein